MPLPEDRFPADLKTFASKLARLERAITELRAARRAAATAIGSGGVLVQASALDPSISMEATGPLAFDDGAGLVYPPALVFRSQNPNEDLPGMLTTAVVMGGVHEIPIVYLATPDLGAGTGYLILYGGEVDGQTPTSILGAGGSSLSLQAGSLGVALDTGGGLTFTAQGGTLNTESWHALTLANGWTATGGTWAAPQYTRGIDGAVQLVGSITPGTLTAGTTVATLPAAYAPAADLEFRVGGGAATASADLFVKSSGAIAINNVAGTVTRISLGAVRIPK